MNKQDLVKKVVGFGISKLFAEMLIQSKALLTRKEFFLVDNIDINTNQLEEIKQLAIKVNFGYPIEYAVNQAEFYGHDFYVDNRCLIPRNDTEVMVDEALKTIKNMSDIDNVSYMDIGTGSGAIPISVILELGEKNYFGNNIVDRFFAVDISSEALSVTKKNREKHLLDTTLNLLESDLLQIFMDKNNYNDVFFKKNVVITANLPYIKNEDYNNMDKEVILHEPAVALYGGAGTGFELYEKLLEQSLVVKELYELESITVFIEIGFDQKEYAHNYIEKLGYKYQSFKDNGGIDRCIKVIVE